MPTTPFKLNVPQSVLDDLQKRLARTRWPENLEGWNHGTNVGYMQELVGYWQNQYDWRQQEAALNQLAQFEAEIDGETVRFIHVRGKGPNPTPIILFHGWPDSIMRYVKLIPMLTDPAKFGGDPNDSFDVIVPWIFDFSGTPVKPVRDQMFGQMAERYWKLMTQVLGYERFAAGGGDGGSPLSQLLAVHHPDSILGLHLTDIGFPAGMAEYDDLSEAEQQYKGERDGVGFQEGAYAMVQGTKPQTLAIGLNDSPVGFAAWVIEKFRSWSDGDFASVYTKDELLTNIMLYWVSDAIDPRGYREEWVNGSLAPNQQVHVPVALVQPPHDMGPVTPREYAERNFKNLQHYAILPRGGHFVAWEDPQPIAEDIRAFFRTLR